MSEDYDEKKKQAIRLRQAGAGLQQICDRLGLQMSTLHRWLDAVGLVRKRAGRVPTPMVTHRRQAKDSTHVIGSVARRLTDEELDAIEKGFQYEGAKSTGLTIEVDPERVDLLKDAARTGDLKMAASIPADGNPDEWYVLGELVTPDLMQKWQGARLLYYLASGVHRVTALARSGIKIGDFEVWLARASNRKEPYCSFIELCSAAQASACIYIQQQIAAKAPGWQALAWTLERLSPEIYARHVGTEDQVEDAAFADVGDDNLKRAALAYIVESNDRKAVDVEFVDLDEIEGRADG